MRAERGAVVVAALALFGLRLPAAADDRTLELLRYECKSEHDRREVTLFGNGTIRLREGLGEQTVLKLDEMTPAELAPYLVELRRIVATADPSPANETAPVVGPWTVLCVVAVALPDGAARSWRFSAVDAPPIAVSQLVHMADALAGWTLPLIPQEHLPASYEPKVGDVLKTADGALYRVASMTADAKGVELDGIDQPLHLIVAEGDLPEVFVAVVERAREW